MSAGAERPLTDFAIEGHPSEPILGLLVNRGLHDELSGEAYAVVDGVDGRIHHLRFSDLERTGDTPVGGIVETRSWTGREGDRSYLSLVGRSDLSLEAQVTAAGATWLDRHQLARDRVPLSQNGFGAEVSAALEQRVDHLEADGLVTRQGGRINFARDLLKTLRDRELAATTTRLEAETGLKRHKSGEGDTVAGIYRQRVDLASGRFAMLEVFGGDGGLGFELVPWKPQLEKHLGQSVTGILTPGGGVDWSLGRKRGLTI